MSGTGVAAQGPTEAEKKLEELTRQLEEELEGREEEGEYFGKPGCEGKIKSAQHAVQQVCV